ncbi:MAG: hypothetical protein AAF351_08055 [Pseudomonadota bacterium]
MTKKPIARDVSAFGLGTARLAAPIGPLPMISGEQINQVIAAKLTGNLAPKRPWIQQFEDFLGRYLAAGYCLAR